MRIAVSINARPLGATGIDPFYNCRNRALAACWGARLDRGTMRITRHRHIMLALLRHQGGVLTIHKNDRALRDVRFVLGRIAEEQCAEVEVVQEDEQTVTYRLVEEREHTPPA